MPSRSARSRLGGASVGWLSSRPHTAAQTAWVSQLTLGAFTLAAVLSVGGDRSASLSMGAAPPPTSPGSRPYWDLGRCGGTRPRHWAAAAGPAAWMFVGVLSRNAHRSLAHRDVTPLERSQLTSDPP